MDYINHEPLYIQLLRRQVISSCDNWQMALLILEQMASCGLQRDAYGYGAVMRTVPGAATAQKW